MTACSAAAPRRLSVPRRWPGSGLRTGRLSPPVTAPNKPESPSNSRISIVGAYGLLVQTPSRQPRPRDRLAGIGEAALDQLGGAVADHGPDVLEPDRHAALLGQHGIERAM